MRAEIWDYRVMANVLSREKQIAVIGALAEGSSIRSIERLTGVTRIATEPYTRLHDFKLGHYQGMSAWLIY